MDPSIQVPVEGCNDEVIIEAGCEFQMGGFELEFS